jgi:hypothetical protein
LQRRIDLSTFSNLQATCSMLGPLTHPKVACGGAPDPMNASDRESWPAITREAGSAAIGSRQPGPGDSFASARDPRRSSELVLAWLVLLLSAVCASAAFATAAAWQLGAIVDRVLELAGSPPVTSAPVTSTPTPPSGVQLESTHRPLRSSFAEGHAEAKPTPTVPLGTDGWHASRAAAQPFEVAAEASERIVPLGAAPEDGYVRIECGDVFVYIVSVAEAAPMASAASLAVGKTSPARFRRPGDFIGDWEVLAITEDWSGMNPAVWLLKGDGVCRAELAGNPARVHVPLKQAKNPPVVRKRRRRAKRR